MKQTCPTCGGEGVLFEQLDVDYFKPVEQCPECEGTEWVEVCPECGVNNGLHEDDCSVAAEMVHKACVE